ncbi:MAG: hypothetical protein Q9166_001465 [cf. Caloplaca sp. 2 TL-2023]
MITRYTHKRAAAVRNLSSAIVPKCTFGFLAALLIAQHQSIQTKLRRSNQLLLLQRQDLRAEAARFLLSPRHVNKESKQGRRQLSNNQIKSEDTANIASSIAARTSTKTTNDDEMAKKLNRLEKQLKKSQDMLKASQDRTTVMMQSLMGGFGNMMQAFAAPTTPAPAAASASQLPNLKRERVEEEDIESAGGIKEGRASSGNRPIKRAKTVIEID